MLLSLTFWSRRTGTSNGPTKSWQNAGGNAVTSTVLRIVENPLSGSPCRFKAKALSGLRRMAVAGFHKHLVFYRLQGRELHVLRVIHGARDLETLF